MAKFLKKKRRHNNDMCNNMKTMRIETASKII